MNFEELLISIKDYPVRTVSVAVAHDHLVLDSVDRAARENVADAILIGDEEKIRAIADERSLSLRDSRIVHCTDPVCAARTAVELASSGEADIVMKGHLHTDDFLRAVLSKEHGLRTGFFMSHVFAVALPERPGLFLITDGAMNIAPTLEEKALIVLNAVHLAHALGLEEPKVGVLAAVELLNPAMPATTDASSLHTMGDRGQFSPKCIVDGPFALDNAISELAARHKRVGGPVAGKADILLVPDIESGNILAKSLVYFAHARVAGVLLGAACPVVLTSRADSAEAKFLSIALSVYLKNVERHLSLKIGKVHY